MSRRDALRTRLRNRRQRWIRLRAAVVLATTFTLPALALVGPDRLGDWLAGEGAPPQVALASSAPPHEELLPGELPPLGNDAAASYLAEESAATAVAQRVASAPHAATQTPHLVRQAGSEAPLVAPHDASFAQARMQSIQRQLQQLGADYMRLEEFAGERPHYRFFCRLNRWEAGRPKQFERIADDPLEAMQWVLADAQRYHARWSDPAATPSR